MQENLNMNNELTEKIAEKLICLEEKLFYRMINNIKNLEKDKHNEIEMISKIRDLEENRYNKSKVEKLNRKLKEGRSLL